MRLDAARLCLDCEEIHDEQECPACGSEVFAFLTRWIQSTAPLRPTAAAAPAPVADPAASTTAIEQLDAWRQIAAGTSASPPGRGKKIVTRSLLGLAAMGLAGWAWAKTTPSPSEDNDS